MTFVRWIAGATVLFGCGLFALLTQAAYIVTLEQIGGNSVVASGAGTIDLTDLSFVQPTLSTGPVIVPIDGIIVTGQDAPSDLYEGVTGPASFGTRGRPLASPTSSSGDTVGIMGNIDVVSVPRSYLSGALLSDTSTYIGETFATLGVTPGTFTWTWGTGVHTDSFTLQIELAAVPEPSSLALLIGALAGLLFLYLSRRKNPKISD